MAELDIFATIHPKPEHRGQALAAIESILEATRAERGCLRFELNVGDDGDPALYLVERWTDDHALDAHYAMDYIAEVFASYDTWLSRPVDVVRMRRHA